MQRPIMDPTYLRDDPAPGRSVRMCFVAVLAKSVRAFGVVLCWCGKLLLSHPLRARRNLFDDANPMSRFLRGVAYRLPLAPILVALISCVLVFVGTHPQSADGADPSAAGIFCEAAMLAADDGTTLRAWCFPVVDARRVLLHRDNVLRQKSPAVVLVHDFGRSAGQLLPLIRPLHEEGIFVIAIDLRGVGAGHAVGQTFGVNEGADVAAAVAHLRQCPMIDPARVGVLGMGSGANAVLLAAVRDPRLAAVVLADPLDSAEAAVAKHVGPTRDGWQWLRTINKWTLQVAYHVDLSDMQLSHVTEIAATRPILRLDNQTDSEGRLTLAASEQVRLFYARTLGTRGSNSASTGSIR